MLKAAAKKVYQNLNPTDKEGFLEDLNKLAEYHSERTNYLMAEDLRVFIPKAASALFDDDVLGILDGFGKEPDKPTEAKSEGNEANEAIQMATNMVAISMFGTRIINTVVKGKTWFIEVDEYNNCEAVTKDRKEYIFTLSCKLINYMADNPISCGEGSAYRVADDKNVDAAILYVLRRLRYHEDIPVYSLDSDEPAYFHPYILPDPDCNWDVIQRWWCGRLSDPAALAAWWYGVYTCQYKGRQIPYLIGGHERQKSLFIETMGRVCFGSALGSLSAHDIKNQNQFFMSSLVRNKLTLIPDNQVPTIYQFEAIKSISGGDPVRVEYKNDADVQSVKLETNLLIMSNFRPSFSSEGYATSRAMVIEVGGKATPNLWVARDDIADAMPGFLNYAQDCYNELSVPYYDESGEKFMNYQIQLSDETQRLNSQATEVFEGKWLDFFYNNFKLEEEGVINAQEVRSLLRSQNVGRGEFVFDNFSNFLQYKYGVVHTVADGSEILIGIMRKEDVKTPVRASKVAPQADTKAKVEDLADLIDLAEKIKNKK